jgi:hypothetical protein
MLAIVASTAILASGGGIAAAAPPAATPGSERGVVTPVPPSTPGSTISSEADLSTSSNSNTPSVGITPNATTPANPYGCGGKTDQPHLTGHGTEASVHARTNCDLTVYYLYVATDLYRLRWYGWEWLNGGSSSRNWNTTSYDATPHWTCKGVGTYTYEGDSYHEVNDGSTIYYAYTGNQNRFAC